MADTVPSELPGDALSKLGNVRSLLDLIDLTGATREDLEGPPRRHYFGTIRPADIANLTFDPASGRFGVRKTDGTGSDVDDGVEPTSWLAFPDPTIRYDLVVETDPTHTDPTGPFLLTLTLPGPVLTLPWLRGAKLDAQGLLVADPDHVKVRFHLPRLAIAIGRTTASGDVDTKLQSATGDPDVFEFCRMEPPHALIGPGTTLGFTFRTAVLDLSDASNPGPAKPPPPNARSLPADWQGIWIPEARFFVAPHGLDDLAVAAGVEDLWIGIGGHYGVTGTFELDVVNRGEAPTIRARFHDADGRWIGTEGTAPDLTAELPERTTLVVDASSGIAPMTTSITTGGVTTNGTRAEVTTPAAGNVVISVTVTDAGAHTSTVNITASRQVGAAGVIPGEGDTTKPAELVGPTSGTNAILFRGGDDTAAELTLADTTGAVSWSWPGQTATGAVARVPVAAGQSIPVSASRTVAATTARTLSAFFHHDHPTVAEDGDTAPRSFAYSTSEENTNAFPAESESSAAWTTSRPLDDTTGWDELLALGASDAVTIRGFASYDGDDTKADYNEALSRRRAEGLQAKLQAARTAAGQPALSIGPVQADGFATSKANPTEPRTGFWKAVASYNQPSTSTDTSTTTLRRPPAEEPAPPVTPTDAEPARPAFPDWFHRIGLRVRLERGDVVLAEINGEIDLRTAAERSLASNDPQAQLPPPVGASDGISQFVLRLDLDKAASEWKVTAAFKAVDADTNGLWDIDRPTGAAGIRAVNTLGAYAALGPLLAAVAPASPASGEVVPLAITAGAATGLAVADVIKTKEVILHGGELIVTHAPAGTDYVVLLDLEAAVGFDAGPVRVDLDKPITTRYRAIGLKLGDRSGGPFEARPVFDPTKGYTLDIPDGAIVASGPLGDILQVFGAKVSKDNPTFLEVDVGVGAELGVVTIDRARVRLRLDAAELPTLSALGASIEVPGAFSGKGYVEVLPDGLAGFFDVSIAPPIGIRASASLKVQRTPEIPDDPGSPTVLGVFVAVEVELPAPIPLGNSGLGIFGFAAGIGVNMARFNPSPPLQWLQNQPGRNPLHPLGWSARPGAWAFAAGATLGTVDGGFLLRLRGLVLLELPGPRVLIVMRARILTPPLDSNDSYPLLATIDISPDALSIGLLAEYDFAALVKLRVPVQAFFNFRDIEDWRFDLGRYFDPVVVSVLDLFRGTGYLMVHGKGIGVPPDPPYLPFPDVKAAGITLAVGFHVSFVWGSTDIGLYAKVAGGFDALISIDPLFVGGKIRLEGELRLFIVSVGASAELTAKTDGTNYFVKGEVCGRVEFFFFDVEGCVDFSLNSDITPTPVPPPLVDGVTLVSRSPALLQGSGTDGPIDGVLGRAHEEGTSPADPNQPDPVPLDVIPAVELSVTPQLAPTFTALGNEADEVVGMVGTPANPWASRGAYWWRYELRSVSMTPTPTTTTGPGAGGPPPCAWWGRGPSTDPLEGTRLALLSWTPNATPKAMPYGELLEQWVHDAWGTTCDPVAPPAPSLFTFDGQPVGESTARPGWTLAGIAWPDDPGTYRSGREPVRMEVSERWRCGIVEADRRRGIDPADVVGGAVACATADPAAPTLSQLADGAGPPSGPAVMATASSRALAAATALLAQGGGSGLHPRELATPLAAALGVGPAGRLGPRAKAFGCSGRVLRSPEGDTGEPVRFGIVETDIDLVKRAWEATGFEPSDLRDGVVFGIDGSPSVVVLFAVSERAFNRGLVFRSLAAEGTVLDEQTADEVASIGLGGLPARWWDPGGPWRDPVQRSAQLLTGLTQADKLLVAVATLKPPPGTDRVEMGLRADAVARPGGEPFLLAAVEIVPASEVRRFDYDVHTQKQRVSSLDTVLAQDPDDHPFLVPGQGYRVDVTWQAFFVEAAVRPADNVVGTAPGGPVTQSFTFTAQSSAEAPKRLDPWVLDTDPGDHEAAAFCDDPVRVSFATQNVADLFDAYGFRLRLLLHGASGRHPRVGAPPTEGTGPLPHEVTPTVAGTAGLRIASPWEEAVRVVVADLPCVAGGGQRDDHVAIQLPFPLDAKTDYLVDLVREPKAGGGASELVYRHGFTTSRYRSLAEFAQTMRAAIVEHRTVPAPGPLGALAANPTGAQLDEAFAASGLDPLGVPRHPQVLVLWAAGAPLPQPVAVVLDANEALWRRRLAPARVTPVDPQDPRGARWISQPFQWLGLQSSGTAVVNRVVEAPGGQRAVVLLAPAQRGRRLELNLVRANDPVTGSGAAAALVANLTFVAAPWEDV